MGLETTTVGLETTTVGQEVTTEDGEDTTGGPGEENIPTPAKI